MINVVRIFIILLLLSPPLTAIGSTEKIVSTFKVYFPVGSSHIDVTLEPNVAALDSLRLTIDRLNRDDRASIDSVIVVGSASPEGGAALNGRLSALRAERLLEVLRLRHLVPDSLLRISATGANVAEYEAISQGAVAPEDIYPRLRYASAAIYSSHTAPSLNNFDNQQVALDDSVAVNVEPVTEAESAPAPKVEAGHRSWRVKTNAVGWAMLVSNVAVEYDFADRWSVAVPIYYSGINYFVRTVKFRTLTLQPEVRYWFGLNHTGWYVGAHLGAGYFNYSTKNVRVQDHDGRNPAYGGGVACGWRFSLTSNRRWQMELAAGVGIYRAYYDKFENRVNGPEIATGLRSTFFGVDQAAATFIYMF